MPPKRKATAKPAAAAKKAKKEPEPAGAPVPAPAVASSTAKPTSLTKKTASDVWTLPDYVQGGIMSQVGFAALCEALDVEEMSFDSIYLIYCLGGSATTVEDAMIVCPSKQLFQRALDGLGCRTIGDIPARLSAKCARLQEDYGESFQQFFRWLFEMGKAISAQNDGRDVKACRVLPLDAGLMLMEPVLKKWALAVDLQTFCTEQLKQPFNKDMWSQISRFVNLTKVGRIKADLSNYDDDESGGSSAWPTAIDEFVEYVQARASQ